MTLQAREGRKEVMGRASVLHHETFWLGLSRRLAGDGLMRHIVARIVTIGMTMTTTTLTLALMMKRKVTR